MNLKKHTRQMLSDIEEYENDLLRKQVKETVFSIKYEDGNIHHHYNENQIVKELVDDLVADKFFDRKKIDSQTASEKLPTKGIIFHNRQAIGDILMFTCAVRDFKRAYPNVPVKVMSTAGHIWDNNPYIDHSDWNNEDILRPESNDLGSVQKTIRHAIKQNKIPLVYIGSGRGTNQSNRSDLHFANSYRLSMQDSLEVEFDQGPIHPDIWLTEEEYNAKPLIDGPYWLITAGEKGDWKAKTYPFEKWQEVVDTLPQITFVQIGAAGHNHPRLQGDNVIDFIGKTEDRHTGIRDLFNLFLNCEGSMGLVSFQMHLAAAFNKPCIVVAGAREPVHFTRYPGHRYLSTDGCLPCVTEKACWKTSEEGCNSAGGVFIDGAPACVNLITPQDIIDSIFMYYKGGRLHLNKKSEKPKLNNIVKKKEPYNPKIKPPAPNIDNSIPQQYGYTWGGSSITDRDWDFIKSILKKYNIKSVLEFGSGLSSLLLMNEVDELFTYETNEKWMANVRSQLKENVQYNVWDGINLDVNRRFDLVFVDGPSGGNSREFSTKIASQVADIVIVHDAGRQWERMWQDKYLKENFILESKGGHRCHLWVKKAKTKEIRNLRVVNNKPNLKLISTARGFGGAQRSLITLMTEFSSDYNIEFIPFHSKYEHPNQFVCGEFNQAVLSNSCNTIYSNYESIKQDCELLVVYSDDYVWEFNDEREDLNELFTNVKAKRKVLICNYRLGNIGKTEWTKNWDKYIFLNSSQQQQFLERCPNADTIVLPPCTDLSLFLEQKTSYKDLVLIRHNSQGDTKFAKDFQIEVDNILKVRPDVKMRFMPGPSFIDYSSKNVSRFAKNQPPVHKFLTLGNLFYYSLPVGYIDAGPRVVIEAMAVGLPVIGDNWGGLLDRINKDTGWICETKNDYPRIIKDLTIEEVKEKGQNAKEFARVNFDKSKWVKEILGQ